MSLLLANCGSLMFGIDRAVHETCRPSRSARAVLLIADHVPGTEFSRRTEYTNGPEGRIRRRFAKTGTIHQPLAHRPLWRVLAAIAMMILAAVCYVGWPVVIVRTVHVSTDIEIVVYGFAVFLAGILGGTCLLWGGAQALIACAAHQLGLAVQATPSRRWALPQGFCGRWLLAVVGTLVVTLALHAWLLSLS